MDFLAGVLVLILIGLFIAYFILKIMRKKTPILNKILFIGYTAFVVLSAFSSEPLGQAIDSVLVMEIFYLIILLIILAVQNHPKLWEWAIGTIVLAIIYNLNYIILYYPYRGIWKSSVEGVGLPLCLIYYLTCIFLVKGNSKASILIKVLIAYYAIFAIAVCFLPPFNMALLTASLIFIALIGVIPGLILFMLYKRNKRKERSKNDEGDKTNEKVKFF